MEDATCRMHRPSTTVLGCHQHVYFCLGHTGAKQLKAGSQCLPGGFPEISQVAIGSQHFKYELTE